jgi:glyoxylase-like metal-dependent hydrolase (beta-lactamase superfamily II)
MFFEVEKVTDRVYRLVMPYVCSYLVVGEEKAVLIDAGWGYGDIKAVAESITDLPLTLILSHGHPDHLGGAGQFEEAFLNERDFEMSAAQAEVALRRRLMLQYVNKDFEEDPKMWQPPRTKPYTPLTEEMTFALGGVTVRPFAVPGHSQGSMVFILPEERIAIFGDAISHPTLMIFDNSATIEEHYEALVKLSAYSHLYERVLVNHETFELDEIVLENNLQAAKAVLKGEAPKIPASKRTQAMSNKGKIYMARKRKPWLPEDAKDIGNINYREDKV